MVIETAVNRDLGHGTYADMLDRLDCYDDPAVHVRIIDSQLGDDALVSDLGRSISYVDLTYAENPDSTIIITAGRHSPEYGGAEAAMELVDKVLASPGMREYLKHGEVTIVPAVNVDQYSVPVDERKPVWDPQGNGIIRRWKCDADRNAGHDTYLADGKAPSYEGQLNWFDQSAVVAMSEPGCLRELPSNFITREAYAVARLLEEKAANGKVLFTADLHETCKPGFSYATLVFDEGLQATGEAATAQVGEVYPVKETALVEGSKGTFSAFCAAKGIDTYTLEGSPFDGDEQLPLSERVEQQMLALDALLDHYLDGGM